MGAVKRLCLYFAFLILIGAVLLRQGFCHTYGKPMPWIDAFFTATSATCVTGLIVEDTGTYFSPIGQVIILLLIQIGGLSIITFSLFFLLLLGKKLTLFHKKILRQSLSHESWNDFFPLLKMVVLGTLIIELLGALLLYPYYHSLFPPLQAFWYALFHAVSAFCNAGFSLHATSFIHAVDHPLVNGVLMGLIILGGLGFGVLSDLGSSLRKLSHHSKLVLITTFLLILMGSLGFYALEYSRGFHDLSPQGKILASLFAAITPRTAGFNTVDYTHLSSAGIWLTCGLMIIGASPGSAGGGMKTTTFALVLLYLFYTLKGNDQVIFHKRAVDNQTLKKAIALFILYILGVVFFTGLLCVADPAFPLMSIFFEVVSAMGTVGLSLGITSKLSILGKSIIILAMYVGRLGPLSLGGILLSFHKQHLRYPTTPISVG